MPISDGYVKLFRKIVDREWYNELPTSHLYIHLLITANWKDELQHGNIIKRGQRLCSLSTLARETHLSTRQTRTALSHLESTGDVTILATPNYSIITLNNYDGDMETVSEPTNDRQTDRQTEFSKSTSPSTNSECQNFGPIIKQSLSRSEDGDKPFDKLPTNKTTSRVTTNKERKEEKNTDNSIIACAREVSSEVIDKDHGKKIEEYLRTIGDRTRTIMEGRDPGPLPKSPLREV